MELSLSPRSLLLLQCQSLFVNHSDSNLDCLQINSRMAQL